MNKKKSFILNMPMFLATKAAPMHSKVLFASCYVAMFIGYFVPLIGTFISSIYSLAIWQFMSIRYKKDSSYNIYLRFLIQRIIFTSVFVFILFIISTHSVVPGAGEVIDSSRWVVVYFSLGLISAVDALLALKGFIGVGYINVKNNN